MTDNRVLVSATGQEFVSVNRSDGLAVSAIRKLKIPQIILSTETDGVVSARAAKLRIPAIHGLEAKEITLAEYAKGAGHSLARTVYIGNDVNDLAAMRLVGYPIAPADGDERVKKIAFHVTRAKGGEGVLREFYETFLRT